MARSERNGSVGNHGCGGSLRPLDSKLSSPPGRIILRLVNSTSTIIGIHPRVEIPDTYQEAFRINLTSRFPYLY